MLTRAVKFYCLVAVLTFCIPPVVRAADDGQTVKQDSVEGQQADKKSSAPLSGRIIDPQGNPVTDARLTLQGPQYLRTETDEDGRYEFVGVTKPGTYRLRVTSKLWVGMDDYRKLPQLAIDPEKTVEKNLTLDRACQMKVTVVDADGNPVRVNVYDKSMAADRYRSGNQSTTDKQGVVTIGGIAPSTTKHVIGVQSDHYAPAQLMVDVSDPTKIPEHKIVLKKGKTIKVRVMCSDNQPATGWSVVALPTWWNFGVYPKGAEIGKDGTCQLLNISDDRYDISVSIPMGDRMSSTRPVMGDASLATMKQPVELKLDHPSPASMNYLTCRIRWIGKPLDKGFQISGYCADLRHHTSHYVKEGAKEVKIGPMPKGTYRIRPENSAIEVMNLRKIKNLVDLDHVKVPNEKPIQIVLRVRGKPHVQGVVVDAETKQPIKSFQFRVIKTRTLEGPNYVQNDDWKYGKSEKGEFESEVVGPGIYVVSVVADGYAIQTSEQVNTLEDPDQVLRLELKRGHTLRGKVVDQQGNPVNGAKVRALSLAGGAMPRVVNRFVTNQGAANTVDGEFEIENLREGFETLRVDHPEFVFHKKSSIKVGKDSQPVTITLTKGATIRGQVFDSTGKPQPNETLFFQDDYGYGGGDREAGQLGKTTTDDEGRYEIRYIPEMTVYVHRADPWGSLGVTRHALLAKDGQQHTLDLGGTNRIDGKFIVNGKPLAGVRLQLAGSDSIFGAMKMYVRTDEDGSFTLFGAPPGRWTLYRQLDGTRSDFAKVRELDVPAGADLDIGTIQQKVGSLTVECETTADSLPERMRMELTTYNPEYLFGRPAATQLPRETPEDPFEFKNVSPGDYELVCDGAGDFQIRHRIKVTDELINTKIPFKIPHGKAKVIAELKTESGPLQGTVMLVSDDERMVQYVTAKKGDDGKTTHTAKNLPAGRYEIRNGNQRKAPVIGKFEIADGETKQVDFSLGKDALKSKGYATIRAADQHGVLVPVFVKFDGDQGDQIMQRRSMTETRLMGPPGKVTIKIELPGFERVEKEIDLGSSREKMEIELKRMGESS